MQHCGTKHVVKKGLKFKPHIEVKILLLISFVNASNEAFAGIKTQTPILSSEHQSEFPVGVVCVPNECFIFT